MQTIYCIPGLGANEKVFQFLDLSFAKPVFIKWIPPLKNETLAEYAMRIKEQFIHDKNPIILGLSLGGMLAVEIAKTITSAKVILISSSKTKNEIPFYWKMFRHAPVYKILPGWIIKKGSLIQLYFLGAHLPSTKKYLSVVLNEMDLPFYRWAVHALVNWKNEVIPSNVIHIHGTKDNLLPYRYVNADITLENGGHLMILENAEEVSACLKQILCKN
ncbi:MAG: alpha/beta hydrolase [Ginsengibacter sp.]